MGSREESGAPSQQSHVPSSQQSSPPGVMFGHHSTNPSSMIPNARFIFNPDLSEQQQPTDMPSKLHDSFNSPPFDGSSPGMRSSGFNIDISSGKKKRGRPRKYTPDGNIALGLTPTSIQSEDQGDSSGMISSEIQAKKHRGRPPGSGKRQLDTLGISGMGFTPHVIMVGSGEDIAAKIMEFSQHGPRTVCILSANGAICNVSLRQPATSGGTVSYEGRFEIISLSGSISFSESNGSCSKTGGLSVSLAGSDGRILGGGVVGILLAATPVHIIVGSFMMGGRKSKGPKLVEGCSAVKMLTSGSPLKPPPGVLSEDYSDENENINGNNNNNINNNNSNSPPPSHNHSGGGIPMYSTTMGWPNSIHHQTQH